MNIYLVRHGATGWNAENRVQGRIDTSLNEKGRQQAVFCRNYFKNIPLTVTYSSPLKRARHSAEIIVESRCPIIICDDLTERDFGNWEGKLWTEVMPELECRKIRDGVKLRPTNGESLEELVVRSQRILKDIISKHNEGENILLVSHGGPIRSIIGLALGISYEQIPSLGEIPNCSITLLLYQNGLLRPAFLNHQPKSGDSQ
ncbi:MAG: histidine phosphatase family protein [Candidatus Woesearchaeota archaeon]